jgi:3'-phosphoadenosine 5'-phosphosulfate sulfotransferase (PAPS reductase)/FAD synthetase
MPKNKSTHPKMSELKLREYDHYIVAFSRGKDSIACVLYLLENGIDKDKIELWHHEIDGREGNKFQMDWPYVPAYCKKFAESLDLKIFFSWKEGGFSREMLRDNQPTAPSKFETPEGIDSRGGKGPLGTRNKFPQVAADLRVRWCSAYLKIDVMASALRAQERFKNKKTIILTGERAQESKSRANYNCFEVDRNDLRKGKSARHVDHLRPIHKWTEEDVWGILQLHNIAPPPSYTLGWGRLSCLFCIFGNCNQWASAQKVDPKAFEAIAIAEKNTGQTIHRKKCIRTLASEGTPYPGTNNPELIKEVTNPNWDGEIFCSTKWEIPSGAFGESNGPT